MSEGFTEPYDLPSALRSSMPSLRRLVKPTDWEQVRSKVARFAEKSSQDPDLSPKKIHSLAVQLPGQSGWLMVELATLHRNSDEGKVWLHLHGFRPERRHAPPHGGRFRLKKEGVDTAAGWDERMKKLEKDLRSSSKMITFWQEKLEEWHEDVQERCGDEVLEELLKLSEEDASDRNAGATWVELCFRVARTVVPLHEALLRRAREEKEELDKLEEVQRSVKERLASAMEMGEFSLHDLQRCNRARSRAQRSET
eukprot:g11078.t1